MAFEAYPEIAARLREQAARNEFGWITIEEKAVCSEPRKVFFARTDPASSPDRGLGRIVSSGSGDTIQVSGGSFDDHARTQPAPDFLKCEVEVAVFRGAERLLKEKRPGISCEIYSEENGRVLLEKSSRLGCALKPRSTKHILALPR